MEQDNVRRAKEADVIRREFEFGRHQTSRSFGWMCGYVVCWLICLLSALFIGSDAVRSAMIPVFGLAGIVFFFLRLTDYLKSVNLVVEDDRLRVEAEELNPGEIDRMELSYGILMIRRKNRSRWSHLSLPIKNLDDVEPLKERLAEFAGRHNIKFEIGK